MREFYIASVAAFVGVFIIAEAAMRGAENHGSMRPYRSKGYVVGVGWYQEIGVGIVVVVGSVHFIVSSRKKRKKPNHAAETISPGQAGSE